MRNMRQGIDVAKVTLSDLYQHLAELLNYLSDEQKASLYFETDETSLYICFGQTTADALVTRINRLHTSVMADVLEVMCGRATAHIDTLVSDGLHTYIYRLGNEFVAIEEGPIVRAYKVTCAWEEKV